MSYGLGRGGEKGKYNIYRGTHLRVMNALPNAKKTAPQKMPPAALPQ